MSISASAVNIYAPTASSSVAVATAASTFTSVAGATRVWVKSSVDAHINFGSPSACVVTTTNVYITAGVDYVFDRKQVPSLTAPDAGFKVKLRETTLGTVWYATVG